MAYAITWGGGKIKLLEGDKADRGFPAMLTSAAGACPQSESQKTQNKGQKNFKISREKLANRAVSRQVNAVFLALIIVGVTRGGKKRMRKRKRRGTKDLATPRLNFVNQAEQ